MQYAAANVLTDPTAERCAPVFDPARDAREELVNAFERDFACIGADDADLRDRAYRLRYDVYCVENAYEDSADNADGRESDAFDSHAPHKMLIHRPTGMASGVVRLILPLDRPDRGLPVMQLTDGAMAGLLPATRTAEVSRFAISRRFREQIRSSAAVAAGGAASALLCHLSIGLMRGVVEIAAERRITHICAVMEPALLRMLSRFGVHFETFGPKINHHGWRQPCFAELDALLARTWAERRDIWNILTNRGAAWPLWSRAGIREHAQRPIRREVAGWPTAVRAERI